MTLEEALQQINLDEHTQNLREEAEIYGDKITESPATYIALPAFVLGFVGGAVGAKVLKGTVGVVAGAAGALWAYDKLREGPKTLKAGQQLPPRRGSAAIAPPPKKTLEGCSL